MKNIISSTSILSLLAVGSLTAGTLQPDAEAQKALTPDGVLKDLMEGNAETQQCRDYQELVKKYEQ